MKSSTRGHIPPFLVMESLREANAYSRKTGKEMIHLSLGQPGNGVPQAVVDAAAEIMQQSALGYTEAAGILELRERIAQHYREVYGQNVPVERIFVTVGSSSAYFLTLLAAFDVGDRVALMQPCYPAYRNKLGAMGLEVEFLRGTMENNFQPNVAMLKALDKPIDGLILCSPSNPTGTILPPQEMEAIIQWCEAHEVRVISDEIYHGMVYGDAETETALRYSKEAVVINSFSKYFLMAGWRLGWVIAPPSLARSYESLLQSFFVSPPSLAQHAALKVFECKEELDRVVQTYAKNRATMLQALPEAGFTSLCPADGAFYIYANVSNLTDNSVDFCREMMQEANVVAVPGSDFDMERGHEYVRFSYCATEEDVAEAMRRLKAWLGSNQSRRSHASA